MKAHHSSRRLFHLELTAFILVWFACVFFSDIAFDTNFASRYYLTKAMMEDGTVEITPYIETVGMDKAKYRNRYFSDKPVGSSLIIIPQYILTEAIAYDVISPLFELSAAGKDCIHGFLIRVFSSCLFSAFAVILYARLLSRFLDERFSLFASLTFFLTTIVFPHSTLGTGEPFCLVFILAAFHSLFPWRNRGEKPHAAGLYFAAAALVVNQTLIIAVGAFLYLLIRRKYRKIVPFAVPLSVAVFFILLYNRLVFNGWTAFPAKFWDPGNDLLLLTVKFDLPHWKRLYEMLFSEFRGLFFFSPFLIMAAFGIPKVLKRHKPEGAALLISFFCYFGFYLFNAGWFGGWDFGWRYIIPALPFLGVFAWFDYKKNICGIFSSPCSCGAASSTR